MEGVGDYLYKLGKNMGQVAGRPIMSLVDQDCENTRMIALLNCLTCDQILQGGTVVPSLDLEREGGHWLEKLALDKTLKSVVQR